MTKDYITPRFLITLICVLLLSIGSKAQIEPIQVGSTTRNMLVYAPADIETNRPLLISMHGMNQDINYQRNQTQWESVADANNFVVVYPAGINNSWDLSGTTDTDFILAIINEMFNRYGIDRDRVYLSGFSMGGMMTYHAATKIADKIAAFAPVSGYLMGGANTNSSRPIPIIHTHGTDDPVVPYSGVETCLNAWVSRNGCPTTAQVTQPYPIDKPSSNGTKYYWGPGTDGVEIVLLSLAGKGHWHSIDDNGVHTSQEIWNFCKNYSLSFGVPKFKFASVTDNIPKQIQLMLSETIVDSNYFNGFTVKVDSQAVTIDSVVLADTNLLVINLNDSILKDNFITLSYNNGNVFSIYEKELVNFNDTIIDNLLKGASPRIIELATNEDGDTMIARFNKKMMLPSDLSDLSLNADYNGDINIPILESSFFDDDSTLLYFSLDEKVYADYVLTLKYSGNNFFSSDSGFLKPIFNLPVTNNSIGLPVYIDTAKLEADASSIVLEFSKPMTIVDAQTNQFTFKVNGKSVSFKDFYLLKNTINFILSNNLHYDDTLYVSYTPGDITAVDKGPLEGFIDYIIENPVSVPTWYQIPGKIEAENYALQSGILTETTADAGGGLNVGWIDNGDWLEYAMENDTAETKFDITFRLASTSSNGIIDFYLDNQRVGVINVPNTGSWQTWRSVVDDIKINPGKHYLKVVARTGGFNINYIIIEPVAETGISKINDDQINIYPNPVSNEMIIRFADFNHDKVEIIDIIGNMVLSRLTANEPELHIPVSLSNGLYFVKISNDRQFQIIRIIIKND